MEDLLRPECWASVAKMLQPWSHIEVRAEDGSYYAELLVTGVDRAWAKVEVLNFRELSTADVSTHGRNARKQVSRSGTRRVCGGTSSASLIGTSSRQQVAVAYAGEEALREHLKTVPA